MTKSRTIHPRGRAGRTASALALAGLVLSACGGGGDDDASANDQETTTTEALGDPVEGGTITVGLEAETNSWLPGEGAFAAAGYNVVYSIYDPLMARNEEGEIEPFLAESMEVSDDLMEWTMTLRPDVTFHDGSALTAEVIKGNFDQFLIKPGSNLAGTLEQVEEVRVVDELTVVYVLKEPNAAFSDLLATAQGVPFSMEAAAEFGADYGSNPVGTGPFKFVSWRRDDQLELTKNEDYWREGQPYLDGIVFRPIPDEESRVSSLQSGEIDAMITLRGSAIKQVQEGGEQFVAHIHTGNESNGSIINVLEPPFDDVRMRKAFAHFLNPEDVAKVLGDDGLVEPSTQFFSPDSGWYSQKVADAYPEYDPAKAKELVEEYMDDPERSDGLPVGTAPKMQFSCLSDASLLEIAQVAQQEAEAAGINVEVRQLEQAVHVANAIGSVSTDPPFAGDFQINCWRMGNEDDPATTFSTAFGDPATESLNFTNFQSDELDGLIEELRSTVEFEDRKALVEEIGLLINENQPYVFATGTPTMVGGRAEVKNITGWTLPDGAKGESIPNARARWGQVWLAE